MKTISVVIAACKARRWLNDCLDGLRTQVLPAEWALQVLVGIDGCAETLQWVSETGDESINCFYLRENHGTYVVFNTLMRYAQGDLIARFDADDVMRPDYLASQIAAIAAGADLTMSWSIYTDVDLRPTSHVLAHPVYHPEYGLNKRGSDGQIVMRREVWQRLGGFRPWRCGADTDFFTRARCAGFECRVVERFLYLRRTHPDSLTAHKDTNFQSPLRLAIARRAAHYRQQYQSGVRGLKVRARWAPDHIRL